MRIEDFTFEYPPELVAQEPLAARDASRLLVMSRDSGVCQHAQMLDLPSLLSPGDLLVVNDTRVLPMRLAGTRRSGGRTEILLLAREREKEHWTALGFPMRKLTPGTEIIFTDEISARVVSRDAQTLQLEFRCPQPLVDLLPSIGVPPLPPYITRETTPSDITRYQTLFAAQNGSAAAPTAGLHFSEHLLARCAARGIGRASVTLHVGIDTFQPMRTDLITDHRMHGEFFSVPESTRRAIESTKKNGGRVVAVGTTAVRALESAALLGQHEGITHCFIYPGYAFRVVDALLTNFHQPRSTLLVMVSAFAGREKILAAYREAITQRYRLFSYGDAMLIF